MNEEISRQVNRGWTTRDIMVTTMLSIALGVVLIPLIYITGYLVAVPIVRGLIYGLNFFPVILVAYLIRKPGVALFSAFIISIIQVPFTPGGVMMLMLALFFGAPVDAVLMARGYKNFSLGYLILVGAVTGFVNAIVAFMLGGLVNLSVLVQIAYIGCTTISGALLGGLLAKLIGRAVVNTGVISIPDKS